MQRVRIRDEAFVCAGEFGYASDWIGLGDWIEVALFSGGAPCAFHEWEVEYIDEV